MQHIKGILAQIMIALSVVPAQALSVPAVCDDRGMECGARERFDRRSCSCVRDEWTSTACPAVIVDCRDGYRFDGRSCRCLPDDARGYGPFRDEASPISGLSDGSSAVQESLGKGDAAAALSRLGSLFDGELVQTASAAVPVQAGAGPRSRPDPVALGHSFGSRPEKRDFAVPAMERSAGSARLIKVGNDTDANPLRHDNAQREAGTWGAGGAIGGSIGGAPGAALGGAGGAIAGGLSGHASDIKEKMEKDEKSYQNGKDATERDRRSREAKK